MSSPEETLRLPPLGVKSIGNYEISGVLGHGTSGVVYLGHHPAIERTAAIKVLRASLANDSEVVGRFFSEARIAAAIRHPHIVEIFDCGTLPDGSPYIIMEHLQGETLGARLRRGAPSLLEMLHIAHQAADALGAAHGKGVVHCDLKPENIFMVTNPLAPRRAFVKVLDFGIAKFQRKLQGPPEKTREGALLGTPLYMSPEQCLGVVDVDARSDIYSLGVIFYEMLCGHPPFDSTFSGEVMNMHLNHAPPSFRESGAEVPAELEAMVMTMLAKKAEGRQAKMEEITAALDRITAGVSGLPETSSVRGGGSAVRRHVDTTEAPRTSGTGAAGPLTRELIRRSRVRRGVVIVAVLELIMAVLLFVEGMRLRTAARAVHLPVSPPNPAPAPPPSMAEVLLDSDPPGAVVTVDGVRLGTTPMTFKTERVDETVKLTFSLQGYREEVIYAVPVAGLKLKPTMTKRSFPRARSGR